MTRDHEFIEQVEGYLDEYEGPAPLPDVVRNAVRAQLPTTKQIGPVSGLMRDLYMNRSMDTPARWGLVVMNNTVRIALAAAAVVVVALVGYQLIAGPNVAGPGQTETPHPTSTPAPTPVALTDGPLEPGRYVARPLDAPNDSISFTFLVPAGWEGFGDGGLVAEQGSAGPDGMGIGFTLVTGLFSDPCHSGPPDVTVGPSVEDLAAAFQEQSGYEATTPTDVTLSGYLGKQMDLIMPTGVDYTECYGVGSTVWEGSIYAQGPGNVWHLWILDVDGVRVVIFAEDNPGTSAEDKAELLAIVDSIRIEP